MKKLLFQFDTDTTPSVFDTVVAYDADVDHVIAYGGLTPETIKPQVEGCIFTRAPKDKKNTAIFVGGSQMTSGQLLFNSIQQQFFANFRVSIMLDSNGSNTTAAAGVAKLTCSGSLKNKNAVVLAGTGPVGQRAAAMLAQEGAHVSITSRSFDKAQKACQAINTRFNVTVNPIEATDNIARAKAIAQTHIVFAAGAANIQLLEEAHWKDNPTLELIADANASPPIGVGGTDMMDRGLNRHGKIIWGSIGFGTLKLALHKACINQLFESNDQVLDAEEIFRLAKSMALI
ncbi:MAG: methylenetetrahydrofolate dehydrogenase [Methylococcales bacterium]|nr:methylenetetrahydrofolate dehydrogenase [Methylococcales bacterium]MBT3507818.1 methylenetetrahydrofolate dehydrogenase [Methylococcales bacterium]MBT3699161.1 methylenetetrahydrofolate dehydrogenase [Methylococcales bacterium]MBT3816147.1 methylenetetrahydrofolate dehydrogenase [Methylococcales bacterium]MBT4032583.1 methylenetetrahydrofolate dehydrogenase [Methylococcales bacterium]